MLWGWSISKQELLERQYNLSKEIEGLNKEIALLEERIGALEPKPKKSAKKQAKKAGKNKSSKSSGKIYFQRKSEKSLDNFIAQKIKGGYLLLTKKEKNGLWKAEMEKAE